MASDPFNVTEDADLGTRLRAEPVPLPGARLDNLRGGAAAAIILVPATHALDQGLYPDLVLYADLVHAYAAAGEAVAQAWGGGVPGLPSHDRRHGAAALVHPWFYALAAFDLAHGAFLASPQGWLGLPFWLISSLGLGLGYLASMMLGFLVLKRRGARELLSQVPLMLVYWLLASGAVYGAAWQFATDPFTWEETAHRLVTARKEPRRLRLTQCCSAGSSRLNASAP